MDYAKSAQRSKGAASGGATADPAQAKATPIAGLAAVPLHVPRAKAPTRFHQADAAVPGSAKNA